jgi:hypothetical protein
MPVNYIKSGAPATAATMNALFSSFDAKMSKMMGGNGKSFALAQEAQMPQNLCGKVFYFIADPTKSVYAGRLPGPAFGGGASLDPVTGLPVFTPPTPVNYNHSLFTNAVAAIQAQLAGNPAYVTWDETKHIALVPRILPASNPPNGAVWNTYYFVDPYMGVFEHSLTAHFLMHQGSKDAAPVPYYIQDGPNAPPEKHLQYALAEIVIEGRTAVDLPVIYDKYRCFRIHNLSLLPCAVTFGAYHSIVIPPFAVRCVRRTDPKTGYVDGFNYFHKFIPGDPRWGWFFPTEWNQATDPSKIDIAAPNGGRAANSQVATSIGNPMGLIHDWLNYFSLDYEDTATASFSAWGTFSIGGISVYSRLLRKVNVVSDISAKYKTQFGDPSKTTTLLGDLIHHKGDIRIIRTSKTQLDKNHHNVVTFDTVKFNGYATIVADFAAHLLTVTPNSDGDYVITNGDPNNFVQLAPVTTNLLKRGQDLPAAVALNATNPDLTPSDSLLPYVLEGAVLEHYDAPGNGALELVTQAEQSVFRRQLVTAINVRSFAVGSTIYNVTGPDIQRAPQDPGMGSKMIHGIQNVTVGDLLALKYCGDGSLASQDSAYTTFTAKSLLFTPDGLALTYIENDSNLPPSIGGLSSPYQFDALAAWQRLRPTRNRAISFRLHGWGYSGSTVSGFWPSRFNQDGIENEFIGEVANADGKDVTINLDPVATGNKMLRHVAVPDELSFPAGNAGRFWRDQNNGTNGFLENYDSPALWSADQWRGGRVTLDWTSPINHLNAAFATSAFTLEPSVLPLAIDHYNSAAEMVNSCIKCWALTAAALAFRLPDGTVAHLRPTVENIPVPMDCFAAAPSTSVMQFGAVGGSGGVGGQQVDYKLWTLLGLTIHTTSDFPSGWQDNTDKMPVWASVSTTGVTGAATVTNPVFHNTAPDSYYVPSFSATASFSLTLTSVGDLAPSSLARGNSTGPNSLGAWNPNSGSHTITPGTEGQYYVASAHGYDPDTGNTYNPGDLIVTVNGAWTPYSSAIATYGSAFYPQAGSGVSGVNKWVQLKPTGTGGVGGYPALNNLGNWVASASLPGPGTNIGDYYTVSGNFGSYVNGNLIIWNGGSWVQGGGDYSDFNWVSITDVRAFCENLGFDFVYTEINVPLELKLVEGDGNSSLGAVLTATGTGTVTGQLVLQAVGPNPPGPPDNPFSDYSDIFFGNIGDCALETGLTSMLVKAGTTSDYPFAPSSYTKFCVVEDPKKAVWKFRLAQPPQADGGGTPMVASIKQWHGANPPIAITVGATGNVIGEGHTVSPHTSSDGQLAGVLQFSFDGVGLAPKVVTGLNLLGAYLGGGGLPGWLATVYSGLLYNPGDDIMRCPVGEVFQYFYQYFFYNFYIGGTLRGPAPASNAVRLVYFPTWGEDGDWFFASTANRDAMLAYGTYTPLNFFGTSGAKDFTAVLQGSNIILPDAGNGGYILYDPLQFNTLALDFL